MSVLDNLLKSLPEGSRFQPKQLNDDAVSQPQAHNFVRPPLQIEQLYQNNQPIVIISAPGAVGKSALARFICGEKKSFLIDLSKLRLGSHTFRGTISNFFGDDNYSSIMSDLKNGKILFVLDAFDEAEIISGSKGIEIFLEELFGLVKDAPNTCLIFLARTSTADFMNLYLDYFASEQGLKLIHSVYSIDYFLENQAIEFIEKQVSQLKKMMILFITQQNIAKLSKMHSMKYLLYFTIHWMKKLKKVKNGIMIMYAHSWDMLLFYRR